MTTTADLVPILERARIVPVVRADAAERAAEIVDALVATGIGLVELTTTVPDWRKALDRVRSAHPEAVVGVGTVLDADAARTAYDRGADFLVTPFPVPEVREVAAAYGMALIGGGVTPAEIHREASAGIAKLFPAHLGGPRYLRSLTAVLPGARIVPTGGITVGAVGEWLAAGALAVGVGSDLYEAADLDHAVVELRQTVRTLPA